MTWVKICGIRDEDALDAVLASGADACGFVFAKESPRYLSTERAAALAQRARGRLLRVGVFVEGDVADVRAILEAVELDALQWSGDGVPQGAEEAFSHLPQIRAVRLRTGDGWPEVVPPAWAYLADAAVPGAHGGTGRRTDWDGARSGAVRYPVILAGGLTPANVAAALDAVGPFGVDVSSGVESGGRKDPERIQSFVRAVRSHDQA